MADDEKGLLDKLQDKATKEVAKRTVERSANRFLDELEEFLLGKKGAADEILEKERQQGSALDRVRREYGVDPDDDDAADDKPSPRELERQRRRQEEDDRKQRARDELAAIKKRRASQRDDDGGATPDPEEAPRSFDAGGENDAASPPGRKRSKRSKRSL